MNHTTAVHASPASTWRRVAEDDAALKEIQARNERDARAWENVAHSLPRTWRPGLLEAAEEDRRLATALALLTRYALDARSIKRVDPPA